MLGVHWAKRRFEAGEQKGPGDVKPIGPSTGRGSRRQEAINSDLCRASGVGAS